jgi:hypothetical protein
LTDVGIECFSSPFAEIAKNAAPVFAGRKPSSECGDYFTAASVEANKGKAEGLQRDRS